MANIGFEFSNPAGWHVYRNIIALQKYDTGSNVRRVAFLYKYPTALPSFSFFSVGIISLLFLLLTLMLDQPLTWTFNKMQTILQSDNETIVELTEKKNSKTSFEFEGKKWIIHNEGFLNANIILERYGEQMVILKRKLLGSKGKIEFKNGNLYSCNIWNSPFKLSFFNNKKKEILSYKLDATLKTVLNIVDHSINGYELLMLIILGFYSLNEIVKENERH